MKILIIAAALALTGGCATCQQHPVYCAVGTAIIVGSVAATIAANSGHSSHSPAHSNNQPMGCASNPASCQ